MASFGEWAESATESPLISCTQRPATCCYTLSTHRRARTSPVRPDLNNKWESFVQTSWQKIRACPVFFSLNFQTMHTFLFALLVACAFAQSHTHPFEACKSDRQSFCGAAASHMEIHRCMHEHWSQLSESCQTAIRQFVQAHHERVHAACGNDVNTFCAEKKGSFEELRSCMSSNWENLSQECKEVLAQHHRPEHTQHEQHEQHTEQHEGQAPKKPCPLRMCANDVHTKCADAQSKDAIHDCLKANFASLSAECRHAIEELIRAANAQSGSGTTSATDATNVASSETDAKTVTDGKEGMASRETIVHALPLVIKGDDPKIGGENITTEPAPTSWKYWLVRLWWTYPVGLVLLIQLLSLVRIRQIRKQEGSL